MITASIDVAAPPQVVYDLVSDVPNLPQWAAETARCEWLDGATGPAVGARFKGTNEHGKARWSTVCTVIAAEPGRRFAFRSAAMGLKVAEWGYDIEPVEGGCRVTESNRILLPRFLTNAFASTTTGIKDRAEHNRRNMEITLAQLKKVAEAG